MKKNKMMRIASALLIAVLLTTCAISGTFAKYVTKGEDMDSARVAKWGVTVNVAAKDAFKTEYAKDSGNEYAVTGNTVISSGTDDVLAPGTTGTLLTAGVSGTPEVAARVEFNTLVFDIAGWTVEGTYYCPLVVTVNDRALKGTDYTSETAFEDAVIKLVKEEMFGSEVAVKDYEPNTTFYNSLNVSWDWAFEGNSDVNDTALGNAAAAGNAATVTFSVKISVTQID